MPHEPDRGEDGRPDRPVPGPQPDRAAAAGRRRGAAAAGPDGDRLVLPTYFASITATSIQRVITTAPSNCGADTAPTITGDGGAGAEGRATCHRARSGRPDHLPDHARRGVGGELAPAKTERAVLVALADGDAGVAAGRDRRHRPAERRRRRRGVPAAREARLVRHPGPGHARWATRARVFLRGKMVSRGRTWRRPGGPAAVPAGPAGYTIPGLKQVRGWPRAGDHRRRSEGAALRLPQRVRPARADLPDRCSRCSRTRSTRGQPRPRSPTDSVMCGPADAMSCPPSGFAAESGLNPDALRVLRCIRPRAGRRSGPTTGCGSRPGNSTSDHPYGNAVDVMIPDYSSVRPGLRWATRSPAGWWPTARRSA